MTVTEPEIVEEETPAEPGNSFHVLIAKEGVPTGDGRIFDPQSLTFRDPPQPFMASDRTTEFHLNSKLVGNFDRFDRQGDELHGWGTFIENPDAEAANLITLIRNGELPGVSADVDDVEYEVFLGNDDVTETEDGITVVPGEIVERVTKGRIMGATAVPFPALTDPQIEVMGLTAAAASPHTTGITEDPWDAAAEEAKLSDPLSTTVAAAMYAWFDDAQVVEDAVPRAGCLLPHHVVGDDGAPGVANVNALGAAIAVLNEGGEAIPGDDRQAVYDHLAKHYTDNDLEPPELLTVTASAAPISPPVEWFNNPRFSGKHPLTISDEGRVFGHIATWDECHIGYAGRCQPPPRSASNYSAFHHGEVRCAGGERVQVGQMCLRGGHADLALSATEAQRFYDDTASAVADLSAGEDRFGIWVAGALRPHLSPHEVRAAMASGVSGDWRPVRGATELINVSSVNVPGFMPPRRARIRESGGMVAAMIVDLPPAVPDVGSLVERIAFSIGRSTAQRKTELYERVHS